MDPSYRSLSDVAKATELPRRTLQLWSDAGVIIPAPGTSHQGTGKHKMFAPQEIGLAATLQPLHEFGVRVGRVLEAAKSLRLNFMVMNMLDDIESPEWAAALSIWVGPTFVHVSLLRKPIADLFIVRTGIFIIDLAVVRGRLRRGIYPPTDNELNPIHDAILA